MSDVINAACSVNYNTYRAILSDLESYLTLTEKHKALTDALAASLKIRDDLNRVKTLT